MAFIFCFPLTLKKKKKKDSGRGGSEETASSHLSLSNPLSPADTTPLMLVDSECTMCFEALVSGKRLCLIPATGKILFPEGEFRLGSSSDLTLFRRRLRIRWELKLYVLDQVR